jgi:hypothetical protein
LGTRKNHKVTNLENKQHVEAWECTFSPEIHVLTMLCIQVRCGDEVRNFQSNSYHPLSQMVQDFKIILLIQCDTKWYKFFMNYPARIEKRMTIVLIFDLFMTANLSWRLSHMSFLILHLGFRVVLKKKTTNFVTCYDPIKKSGSALSR